MVRQVMARRRKLGSVGEPPVVAERDRAPGGGAEGGLRVLPRGRAVHRVAGVPDGDVAGECAQGGVVEDLRHEPHVLVDEDLLPVGGRDPRGFLPAVLQRVQPEVGEFGDLLARRPQSENAAFVLRRIAHRGIGCGSVCGRGGAWRGMVERGLVTGVWITS